MVGPSYSFNLCYRWIGGPFHDSLPLLPAAPPDGAGGRFVVWTVHGHLLHGGRPEPFMYRYKVSLHSVQDYKDHILNEQAKTVAGFLTALLVLVAVIYLSGLGVAWVRTGFRAKAA